MDVSLQRERRAHVGGRAKDPDRPLSAAKCEVKKEFGARLAVMPTVASTEAFSVKVESLRRDVQCGTGQVYNGLGGRGEGVCCHIDAARDEP
ncbi:hypothetical protein L0Z36_02205 [Burkholderia multivorans]|uniref:hypothetical protein n=1 Tax=Burkholderia TaxID=32008 RepID=UPI000F79FB33|nr:MULTISPECIES: hypothetical protein [Burkholderia]EKS9915693.1 hypothetical protein [Burkholderia multivorans]MBH9662831.1 hypothetical protein [Burkholderia multivorans]MBJ9682092.1 hypothetical protein [Burkholderia multivorans]MDN7447490.1 hypothetical protein [Burkholderia multivorans]UQN71271.1 hypothetical protein L0Z45_17195 [Burkholderia multivorans]